MNNSYRKVDEIQVGAKHAPLMYVIYVCTLTPQSSALRIMARAPRPPHQTHQSGGTSDRSARSALQLKQRVINKYMFPLKVGVFATASRRMEGAPFGGLAGDVPAGQVLLGTVEGGVPGWLLCCPLVPSTHQERTSQQSREAATI